MGRPFFGTVRGGSEECSIRCTPKCPSKATAVTVAAGGKSSKGLLIFTTSMAGKSTLKGTT